MEGRYYKYKMLSAILDEIWKGGMNRIIDQSRIW